MPELINSSSYYPNQTSTERKYAVTYDGNINSQRYSQPQRYTGEQRYIDSQRYCSNSDDGNSSYNIQDSHHSEGYENTYNRNTTTTTTSHSKW